MRLLQTDAVTVERIGGNTSIQNAFATTTVRNVEGNLRIEYRNGSVEASGVTGNALISNSFG